MESGTGNAELNFCLMTNISYLPKALVMYDSLKRQCRGKFRMFYIAFDDITLDSLKKLDYENIIPVPFSNVENEELLAIKNTRSAAEYFFTSTPRIIWYCLDEFNLDHVIYVDADLFFYQDPSLILDEMGSSSVLITEHWYHPPVESHPSGKYCVQFIPFRNDIKGRKVLEWWMERCLEWCYTRSEEGKWADQGYLNDWPERFDGVHVMVNRGGGVARWNIDAYEFYASDNQLMAYSRIAECDLKVIFYHFHSIHPHLNGWLNTNLLLKDRQVFHILYKEYLERLFLKEEEIMNSCNIDYKAFGYPAWPDPLFLTRLKKLIRRIFPKKTETIIVKRIRQNGKVH